MASYEQIRRLGNDSHRSYCMHHTNNLPGAPGHEAWVTAHAGTQAAAEEVDEETDADDQ